MATGLSSTVANGWLDALGNATNYTAPVAFYIKLHIGDPGAAGASNAATETTRKSVSFGASVSGAIVNDVAITWTNVSGSEDYTHWSGWDAVAAGNFLCSGTVTANVVVAADTFTIAVGDLDLTLSIAS